MMKKDLCTVTGDPANGGTRDDRKRPAIHPPTAVPANGGPSMVAVVATPLLPKVTATLPDPVGPSGFLQPWAAVAVLLRMDPAAARSNSPEAKPVSAACVTAGGAGAGAGVGAAATGFSTGAGFSSFGAAAATVVGFLSLSGSGFGGGA